MKKKTASIVESDGVLTSRTVQYSTQKSFADFDRFNHRRIFSFYPCYADKRLCHVQISHTHHSEVVRGNDMARYCDYVYYTPCNTLLKEFFEQGDGMSRQPDQVTSVSSWMAGMA